MRKGSGHRQILKVKLSFFLLQIQLPHLVRFMVTFHLFKNILSETVYNIHRQSFENIYPSKRGQFSL